MATTIQGWVELGEPCTHSGSIFRVNSVYSFTSDLPQLEAAAVLIPLRGLGELFRDCVMGGCCTKILLAQMQVRYFEAIAHLTAISISASSKTMTSAS